MSLINFSSVQELIFARILQHYARIQAYLSLKAALHVQLSNVRLMPHLSIPEPHRNSNVPN